MLCVWRLTLCALRTTSLYIAYFYACGDHCGFYTVNSPCDFTVHIIHGNLTIRNYLAKNGLKWPIPRWFWALWLENHASNRKSLVYDQVPLFFRRGTIIFWKKAIFSEDSSLVFKLLLQLGFPCFCRCLKICENCDFVSYLFVLCQCRVILFADIKPIFSWPKNAVHNDNIFIYNVQTITFCAWIREKTKWEHRNEKNCEWMQDWMWKGELLLLS